MRVFKKLVIWLIRKPAAKTLTLEKATDVLERLKVAVAEFNEVSVQTAEPTDVQAQIELLTKMKLSYNKVYSIALELIYPPFPNKPFYDYYWFDDSKFVLENTSLLFNNPKIGEIVTEVSNIFNEVGTQFNVKYRRQKININAAYGAKLASYNKHDPVPSICHCCY